jgi:hypothetical protein
VAVVLAQGTLGRGTDMAKDKAGCGLGGDALQVGAVPGGNGGCEKARRCAKFRVGVEAYTEAICIVLASSCILQSVASVRYDVASNIGQSVG